MAEPHPIALRAAEVPPRAAPSGYPPDLVAALAGREKRVLGDRFGLTNFGVNLTRLPPGEAASEVARSLGLPRRDLYRMALAMREGR
jgi:hypothetical protein